MLYELIPTMPEVRLLPLIERFTTMLTELSVSADTFGATRTRETTRARSMAQQSS
jgi:hypothetical protein